ncbi:MAG TPA: D-glycero-beta-D-manno-heptose 1-phosphate adenylyltransferase, partial [Caulobacteraceae bacterium]
EPERAMAVAHAAAGVAVGKHGTAVVTPPELAAKLSGDFAVTEAGVAERDAAERERATWKAHGLTVGFTNGCFDILHPGHVSLLEQAAAECDRLIVALNTDASVSRLKGPTRPVQPLEARARVIAALRGVALVTAFDEDTPQALIEALVPDVLVKGADYAESEVVGGDVVKAAGGRVVLAELVAGQSTTAIVERGGA